MPETSAGILLFRRRGDRIEVLLGHPGGPFFRNKDEGSWTVPKGLYEEGEDPQRAAVRELNEETGLDLDPALDELIDLGEVKYRGGKRLRVWALEGDCDPGELASNDFEIEWPPRSGKRQSFPEIDRFAFFPLDRAADKILSTQAPLLERLAGSQPP